MPFKGSIFQTQNMDNRPEGWPDSQLALRVFDQKHGLGDWVGRIDTPLATLNPVPVGEFVMATGKVVARKIYVASKEYDLIFALECITSKGVGYLPRERLRGPLKKTSEDVKLETD